MKRQLCLALLMVATLTTVHSAFAAKGKKDSNQPVDINADNLVVNQEQQAATFSGNVIAKQGDITIKSDQMIVHYREKKTSANQNSVSRIEVIGHVFLTTKDETASGTRGEYNVDKKLVTLTGNVVLTQGKSVVKGDALVYNVDTGKSELSTVKASNGQPSTSGGRVRGVFIPNGN